ncbi:MAG TPA: hypothetical protein VM260_11685 [Pirellula sp.]|nr:hypothetical protein [Pirellula sp.]
MISKRIDKHVELTKWPAAVLAVSVLPLTVYAWWKLFFQVQSYPFYSLMFAIGVGLFVLLARTPLAQSAFARRVIELERDLTQSVLAFTMLHPVVVHGANEYKVAQVRWLGRGNWIMLAAPYFVPTATILLWLVSLIFFQSFHCLVLGFGISYHLTVVTLQCHLGTSETRRLGKRFCRMFLPATNLLVAGFITAFALNGFAGMADFLYDWLGLPRAFFHWIWESVFAI